MPTDTLLTNPSAEASRSSTFLSRFSSPLSKRARNVFDFAIEPEEPYKTFSPGDKVRGHIVLSVLKGFDITHMVIGLHGFAKVFKHQSERRPTPEDLAGKRNPPTFEYLGNGLVSLFHDEQVLCGSGFLKKQIYKFGFELQFPNHSLPTTIDFERGMVFYMISATVTRPATIAPTVTKTVQIKLRDRIDIEHLYVPKTRMISLEPINRRGKVKKVKTSSSISTQDASGSARRALTRNDTQSSDHSRFTAPTGNPPLSPAPSEDTIATTTTVSTESMQVVENESPVRKPSPQTSETRSSATSSSAHTITATVELARHGALPGDVVPIHVSVTHTKPNVRGVIIATLYRTIRVDMHPDIPLASKNKDKKQHEDIYPRSMTGLGGLYFANSAPSSVFRKDISQNSTMMIIDPKTMTADVSTSIKIPVEDALPTMTNLPGGMMSFTYHIEVVIDLAGKLGESRLLPSLTNNGPTFTNGPDNGNHLTSDWSRNILDTTQLRRTKSVVTSVLPMTIGTKDTRREQEKAKMKAGNVPAQNFQQYDDWSEVYGPHVYDANGYWPGEYQYDEYGNSLYGEQYGYDETYAETAPHPYIPPPPQQQEEGDEKSRLRRQEELLMPSQPPVIGESSSSAQALVPSAPVLSEGDDPVLTPVAGQDSLSSVALSISRASARSGETIVPETITPPPSLPDETDSSDVTEDKQELERRRLMAQASAPPTDNMGESSSRAPSAPHVATAPTIGEDEEYTSQTLHDEYLRSESLPRYQR